MFEDMKEEGMSFEDVQKKYAEEIRKETGGVEATAVPAKTKTEKTKAKTELATLTKLQEEMSFLGWGVATEAQKTIESMKTPELRPC